MKRKVVIALSVIALLASGLACKIDFGNTTPPPAAPTAPIIQETAEPPTEKSPEISPTAPADPCNDPLVLLFLLRSTQTAKEFKDVVDDAGNNIKGGQVNIAVFTKDLELTHALIARQKALETPAFMAKYQDHHLKSMEAFASLLEAAIKGDRNSVAVYLAIAKTEEDLALAELKSLQKQCPPTSTGFTS